MLKTCTKCNLLKSSSQFAWAEMGRRRKLSQRSMCNSCRSENQRRYADTPHGKKMLAKYRSKKLERMYGITIEDYERMFAEQGGKCAICGSSDPGGRFGRRFHVDHDHKTGAVRALLCSPCNVFLGFVEDNPIKVEKIRAYLEEHSLVVHSNVDPGDLGESGSEGC